MDVFNALLVCVTAENPLHVLYCAVPPGTPLNAIPFVVAVLIRKPLKEEEPPSLEVSVTETVSPG